MKIYEPWWPQALILLTAGALVEGFFPSAVYFFAGLSIVSVTVMAVGFIVMLIANASDTVDDIVDDYDDQASR